MRRLRMDPVAHRIHWNYYFQSKVLVLEQAGNYQEALDLMQQEGVERFSRKDRGRIEGKLKPGS
jgi:hypothetical protein